MTDRPGEMDERDVEERFASIVAAWDTPLPDEGDGSATDATDDPGDGSPAVPGGAEESGPDAPARPRPPWVNPSPLDLVVPASTWRTPTTPAGPGTTGAEGTGSDGQGSGSDGTTGEPAATAAPDDGEHFEPPPVTLPPQEDLHFWGAVVGLVGGPLLLLYVALARPFHSERWFAAGVLLSLVGFALLVLRQPRHRDPDDTDDGARI